MVAGGDNSFGQCNVSEWKDIVAVAAGGSHTVGLMSDGTVVAVGATGSGQCDVFSWTDIVAIAAGDQHTVGLKADGTVEAVGNNRYGKCDVSGWQNIIAIAAGKDQTVGLKADGTVVITDSRQRGINKWLDIVAIAAGGSRTMGLKADGTVLAVGDFSNDYISDWTDIRVPGVQPAVVYAWSVIGGICGTGWARDFPMTEVEAGVWQSEPLDLKAGEELKARADGNWTVNRGLPESGLIQGPAVQDGANIRVHADGTYVVFLDLNDNSMGLRINLSDGVYTADFKSDSNMFHVNKAYGDKGTLTVKNGKATIHITLPSKSIVHLYLGLAADAKEPGAALLSPTLDSVTYSDGTTEEVYGFDIPVPVIGVQFDLAIVGTNGKWYDHKVIVSNPVPKA